MRRFPRPIQAYIVLVIAAGVVALSLSLPRQVESSELILFFTLAVSGILAAMYRLPMVYSHLRIDLLGPILLMAAFLASPSVACLLAAFVIVASGLLRRRRLWSILFNAAAETLGIGFAAALYHGMADPDLLPLDSWVNVAALLLSACGYWLANGFLVMVLVAADNGEPFFRNFAKNYKDFYVQMILMTLLAVLGAAAWHQGALYALLLIVPTAAVYQLLSVTHLKQEQVIHAIEIIAEVLDRRNPFTFQHSQRVAEHATKIARSIGLTQTDTEVLRRAALIHDIGKLGLDDPAEEMPANREDLTDYQFYSLKQHAQLGAMIAREIPAFEEAEEPIRYHHDWYDGSHVSKDHAGEEIPLGARIIAVADSYDSLCMANGEATLAYDPKAVEQLSTMGSKRLDPQLLARFLDLLEEEQAAEPMPVPQASPPRPVMV